ncbi:MAG: hypothetical protein R3304_09985 [Longimicrobiales bacterium]|nr:hypothetical protein [Longimicrobiales bacterium]
MSTLPEVRGLTRLAARCPIDVRADLRVDSPFGPIHVRSVDTALVVEVEGWPSAIRLALWLLWNQAFRVGPVLRALAISTGRAVYLDAGRGPRLPLARSP